MCELRICVRPGLAAALIVCSRADTVLMSVHTLAASSRRSALSAFLSAKGMLPPAAPAAQAASGHASAAAGTSAAPPPLPDGWQALLDTS